MAEISVLSTGAFETNCYLVWVAEKKRLYVVDPGCDAGEILDLVKSFPYASSAILLTHAHVDHISALGEVAAAIHPDYVFLGAGDEALYRSPDNRLPPYYGPAENLPKTTSDIDSDGDFSILPLPGHSPGGCGFYFKNNAFALVGDTIFSGSVGRTDFPGGDAETLFRSIREELFSLPGETVLYPGHGGPTSVQSERDTNPYVRG